MIRLFISNPMKAGIRQPAYNKQPGSIFQDYFTPFSASQLPACLRI